MNINELQNVLNRQTANRLALIGAELEIRRKYKDTPCGFHSDDEYYKASRELEALIEANEHNHEWKIISSYPGTKQIFLGREEELQKIRTAFERGQSPVWLCGLAGIGKTSIAEAYLEQYKDAYEQVVFLTYGDSIRELIEDDSSLSIQGLVFDQHFYNNRLRYFRIKFEILKLLVQKYKTLIVLDNYEVSAKGNDRYFTDFIKLPCDILLTSRRISDYEEGSVITVGALPDAMVDSLIDSYQSSPLAEEDRHEIHTFARKIGNLTLPLVMKIRNPLLDEETALMNLDLQTGYGLKKQELQALLYLAVMPVQGMPEKLYLEWTDQKPDVLEKLQKKMLIRRYKEEQGIDWLKIHPLIAGKVKQILNPTVNNCKQYLMALPDYIQGSSLSSADNGNDGKNTWSRSREENQREAPYIMALLDIFEEPVPWLAEGCDGLVTWLWIMRYDKEAENYSLKLFNTVEKFYGRYHQITAQMALRTAAMYWNTGRKEEAYSWYHLGYAIIHRAAPANVMYPTICFTAAEKLATNVYAEIGDMDRTLKYLEEALALWKSPKYPKNKARRSPIFAMRQMCECLLLQNRLSEAEELWGEIDSMAQDWFKARTSWLPFLALKARLWDLLGDKERALSITAQMLDGLEVHSISHHKEMILARENAGDLYKKYGQTEMAMVQYCTALSLLGDYYPDEAEWQQTLREKIKK